MVFAVSSPAFDHEGEIPSLYTCDGRDISPPLHWREFPPQTQSFALIVEDPDAPDPANPRLTWVHWMLYNIPPSTDSLPEDVTLSGLPAGTLEGLNDWRRTGYGGPCPPIGRHRYFHRLYALDCLLPDLARPRRPAFLAAIKGHILRQAELIGTYKRV
jgi:Raf kinase inhibitor-like YbhB/YbcL family protein